jgi:hypothetical protein
MLAMYIHNAVRIGSLDQRSNGKKKRTLSLQEIRVPIIESFIARTCRISTLSEAPLWPFRT